jgi:hypothetical protein
VVDGRLAGSWTRTSKSGSIRVDVGHYKRPTAAITRAVAAAADRYARFMRVPVELVQTDKAG